MTPPICIEYKYNKKTLLVFAMTKEAEMTPDGWVYETNFQDKYGNVCT